ncbi:MULTISPECIES: hypothetical protein [unclassified Actinopolyspora]|uniref:hypothetical protein n=1 Tax=unclassified Actinopolyspora TaxID=2639451 RepID=UPI0013F62A5D|nr:hypothetical protein [Actinopolyspora sp. BKK2]NHE75646.1 hypothetical protein [Actinopolyspora sp. BKK1]
MRDSESAASSTGTRPPGLHQPRRLVVFGIELVLAALLVATAFPAWGNSVVHIDLPAASGGVVVSRMLGSWVTLAVLAVTAAGLLLLDGLRQLMLGVGGRSGARDSTQPPLEDEPLDHPS